ncbi:hypothetical protein [Paenibacillus wynnii]|uniref:hypothetical protein n=1 Tax=Paenibacillus wynnii TaxID=268407 RepID=UPI00278D3B7D|nr:hypothetical protein [Paenibacillus wynnii]MDQ0193867.1 hypothetical protein [Paenibacillus wynnii]
MLFAANEAVEHQEEREYQCRDLEQLTQNLESQLLDKPQDQPQDQPQKKAIRKIEISWFSLAHNFLKQAAVD